MNNKRNKQYLNENECDIAHQVNEDVVAISEKKVVDYIKQDWQQDKQQAQ